MRRKGQSTIELVALMAIVVTALIAGSLLLRRGVLGRFHAAGDAISFGMLYDGGQNCLFNAAYGNTWYDADLFIDAECDTACFSTLSQDDCSACVSSIGGGCN